MPICKRDGFDNASPKNKKGNTFHDNEEVFFCETTKEIFRDYEEYFRHVMVINSTVWQCEATGRDNLTYAEALKSERRARKKMELFKDFLRPVVILVIEHAKQSSIKALNAIVYQFLRKRYFLNEEITACHKSTTYNVFKVIDIINPSKPPPANNVYDATDNLLYKLQRVGYDTVVIVPYDKIRRSSRHFSHDNIHMFIKNNVTRVDGILRPKPESYKKYITDRNVSFGKLFIGKMPHFTPSKIRRPNDTSSGKEAKQSTMSKYLVKNGGATTQQKEEAEKTKNLIEEMERVHKQQRLTELARQAELERQKVEKRAQLILKIEEECTDLLTKTDDLNRKDQKLMPALQPVQTLIPSKFIGECIMVLEFMHSFASILSGIDCFRNNINFYELSRAFTTREVAGPLSDILLVLLGTIFDLNSEEEEECPTEYILPKNRNTEPYLTISAATKTHFYVKRHFSFKLSELPIDAQTISEVLRLHLLASGASTNERSERWRVMYRNGYYSSEDPGLSLRMEHPHILQVLKMYTVFQLPMCDIMRIVQCLISQILTYSSTINVIEERMETMNKAKAELKILSSAENKRLSNVANERKRLTTEYHMQCLEEDVKNDSDKKKQLEEKLNKKVAEIMSVSDRDRKKFETLVKKLNSSLFDYMLYLGMDRAYRKYYVFESIAGIFVEHPAESYDSCLEAPPVNSTKQQRMNYPRNRKDLRAYLMRIYTDEEKAASANIKPLIKTKAKDEHENKENQENQVNAINGNLNGDMKMDVVVDAGNSSLPSSEAAGSVSPQPPTQYQLMMCTGDPKNCIVHDEKNADRQRWAYIHEQEDIDALIASLNPLGERECSLLEQLLTMKPFIINHVKKCPADMLSLLDPKSVARFKTQLMSDTNKKYHTSNFGYTENSDLNEVMYSALVNRILQFEFDITSGDLGKLKVKNLKKWREDIQNNTYDPQLTIQYGNKVDGGERIGTYATKSYTDPGDKLGDMTEIRSDDSADEDILLHDSSLLRTCVKNLGSALLQIEQGIEPRFLKEPFGTQKDTKDKERMEQMMEKGRDRLKQWELSLMHSTSYSQVFLHLNVLHDSIIWSRSTNKSKCQICRRTNDPEKMLLCDNCNGGTHMFCMKPQMKTVPDGNWYCRRCVTNLGLTNTTTPTQEKESKRKRAFLLDDEDTHSESSTSSKNKRNSGNHNNKPIRSAEIEEELGDDNENDEDDDDREVDEENDQENGDDGCEQYVDEADSNDVQMDSEDNNLEMIDGEENMHTTADDEDDQDEDDDVCVVCSYDGGEITCYHCNKSYHLDCANLRRTPRYNWSCNKCKQREEKKRRSRTNEASTDDDEEINQDPIAKRSRLSRTSARNSLPNGNSAAEQTNNNGRRSRRTGDHLPLNSSVLYDLLEDINKNENSWPFVRPVLQSEVPDYYKIIKDPMDFAKVKSKLNMGDYQLNEELLKDIQLIFRNCDTYNMEGNEIYEAGSALEKFIIDRCMELHLPFQPSDMNTAS